MPTTGTDATGKGPTAKIFVSYSREDSTFADRLAAALSARGFEALIDRTVIYAFEDWWQRVQTLVGRADTVVFVLSPDAVASDSCQKEVAFAMSLNKRLAPIVWRRVDDQAVPQELRRLNFIFFQDDERFDACMQQLTDALGTNIEWVRQHTAFGEQARRWKGAERTDQRGLLLRSPVLEEAERWIASRPYDAPIPTHATQAFVMESRRAATRKRNILSGGLGVGLAIALGLAGFAYWQREIAIEQRRSAEEQRRFAEQQRGIAVEQRSIADQQRMTAQASETRANRTLARADHQRAAQLVEESPPKPGRALAYLARAIRSDPTNSAIGRRAVNLVAEHPHIRPATASVRPAMAETRAFKAVDGRKGVRSPDGRWALRFTNKGVQVRLSGVRTWLAVEEEVKFTLDYTLGVFAKSSDYAVVVGGYWTEFGGHNEIKLSMNAAPCWLSGHSVVTRSRAWR
jgi:TIR domain